MAKPGATPIERPPAGSEPATVPALPTAAGAGVASTQRPGDDLLIATFNQCRDELVSTLLYLLGNTDDAQDAAQEAFLKCWRARGAIADVQNLRAWIFRVGLNTAKDMQRSAWHRRAKPLNAEQYTMMAKDASPGESLERKESLARLRRAIVEELREEEKEVFLLRQNGDLTYEEIAEMRSCPVSTVKTQMRSALEKLRKVLNPAMSLPA
jgi:RNA polymerase sigma-70 factor (ECF subfamily)